MEVMLHEIIKLLNLLISELLELRISAISHFCTAICRDGSLQAETREADIDSFRQPLGCLNDDTLTLALQLIDILLFLILSIAESSPHCQSHVDRLRLSGTISKRIVLLGVPSDDCLLVSRVITEYHFCNHIVITIEIYLYLRSINSATSLSVELTRANFLGCELSNQLSAISFFFIARTSFLYILSGFLYEVCFSFTSFSRS